MPIFYENINTLVSVSDHFWMTFWCEMKVNIHCFHIVIWFFQHHLLRWLSTFYLSVWITFWIWIEYLSIIIFYLFVFLTAPYFHFYCRFFSLLFIYFYCSVIVVLPFPHCSSLPRPTPLPQSGPPIVRYCRFLLSVETV